MTSPGPGEAPTDAALVERALAGDLAAWAGVVERYQADAFRTAQLIARSTREAADVTRDAFVRAYRALDSLEQGERLRPWLLRVVVGEAHARRRESGRQPVAGARGPDTGMAGAPHPGGPVVDGGASPPLPLPSLGRPLLAEERATLVAAVDRLAEDERLLVLCRYLLGLPDEDVAAILGVGAGSIPERRRVALERLRLRLGARSS